MERKELTVKDLELAIEKLKECEARKPHKVFIANDNFLQKAVDYFSDCADVVVIAQDGRRFCKGKRVDE